MKQYRLTATFDEPLLGAVPLNKELYGDYIADRAPSPEAVEEELMTVSEALEKGTTGFHRVDGAPILYDYVVKGFLKDACSMLRRDKDAKSAKLQAFKKVIDGMVFVMPRRIPIVLSGEIEIMERPLRAQTAQGERVALARSECAPAGSRIEFDLKVLGTEASETLLREWFDYGALRGFGQWRNASWGRFTYVMEAR